MSEQSNTNGRWWLAGLFLVVLLGLNLFPPDSTRPPWKDPFLVALAVAMLALLVAPRKKH